MTQNDRLILRLALKRIQADCNAMRPGLKRNRVGYWVRIAQKMRCRIYALQQQQ